MGCSYQAVRAGQDDQLKNLRLQLAGADAKLIETRSRFTQRHPAVQTVLQQRDEVKQLYQSRMAEVLGTAATPEESITPTDDMSRMIVSQYISTDAELVALQEEVKVIQAAKANLQSRLTQLPPQQAGLSAIVRQREEAAATLKQLKTKLEEARIAEAQLVGHLRVVDPASPARFPSDPKPLVVIAIALFSGVALSLATVLLVDALDNKLHNADEIAKLLEMPVLGNLPVLPFQSSSTSIEEILDTPRWVEPYRMLLKSLEVQVKGKAKIILVSSTTNGEGKSNVIAHLGAVAATLSGRTLIIDSDLQRPLQHHLLSTNAAPGLTQVVVNGWSWRDAVQLTPIRNLSLLSFGEFLKRPSVVAESTAMKTLIEQVSEEYDLILVDTTVLSQSVDATTLSQSASGLAIVARPHFTRLTQMQQIVADLRTNQVPLLGVVMNANPDPQPIDSRSASAQRLSSGSLPPLHSPDVL